VSIADPGRGTRDVWIFDVARGLRERFTFDAGDEFAPLWSPDGSRIVYSARRKASIDLYQKPTRGGGDETPLPVDGLGKFASHWSPDGRFIIYIGGGGIISRSDLWALPLFGDVCLAISRAGRCFPQQHASTSGSMPPSTTSPRG